MRGTPERAQADDAVAGLIPARAGNTATERGQAREPSAHPRSRGEHKSGSLDPLQPLGSSPLTRGTCSRLRGEPPPPSRLIPARAGSTLMLGHVLLVRRAHPRSRGEHYHKQAKQMRDRDSSPLARGTRSPAAPLHRNARLIPARAGNTTRASPSLVPSSAHPRSRGEHQLLDLCRSRNYGSSPLARGTLIALIGSVLVLRLIPARAGNTPGLSPPRRQWSAHPRSRGEHVLLKSGSVFDSGSSPLARGTLAESRA